MDLPPASHTLPLKEIRFLRQPLHMPRTHTFAFPPCRRRGRPDPPLRTNQGKNSLEIP